MTTFSDLKKGDKGYIDRLRFEVVALLPDQICVFLGASQVSIWLDNDDFTAAAFTIDPPEWEAGDEATWGSGPKVAKIVAIHPSRPLAWIELPMDRSELIHLSELRRPSR